MSDRLTTNQWMANDTALVSADNRYAAYLQDDGNFVLCHTTNGAPDLSRPYWSAWANTSHFNAGQRHGPPYFARMQSDGNFVLYNGKDPASSGAPYWATDTSRPQDQFTAVIQTDGNFVVYQGTPGADPKAPGAAPIWASNTWCVSRQVTSGDSLSDQWMANDTALVSADNRYAAYLQSDGNFVLCHTTNGAPDLSRPYWSALGSGSGQVRGQPGGPPYHAVMQTDGNFVLYNGSDPCNSGAGQQYDGAAAVGPPIDARVGVVADKPGQVPDIGVSDFSAGLSLSDGSDGSDCSGNFLRAAVG